MRTTVDIDGALLRQAKEEAARTNRPLRQVIEDALRESFNRADQRSESAPVELTVSERKGGLCPGVNIDRWAELLDVMGRGDGPS